MTGCVIIKLSMDLSSAMNPWAWEVEYSRPEVTVVLTRLQLKEGSVQKKDQGPSWHLKLWTEHEGNSSLDVPLVMVPLMLVNSSAVRVILSWV